MNRSKVLLMVKLRGLGYSQIEIAQQLDVSQSVISYQLAKVNTESKILGVNKVFMDLFSELILSIALNGGNS